MVLFRLSKKYFHSLGDIDIAAISENLKDRYRGGVKITEADLGYQQYLQEEKMPIHTYLLSGIKNWFLYSLNWVLRRQSLLINKDPTDLVSAVFAAHIQGDKYFDRTVTFMKPEIRLKLNDDDLNFNTYGYINLVCRRHLLGICMLLQQYVIVVLPIRHETAQDISP